MGVPVNIPLYPAARITPSGIVLDALSDGPLLAGQVERCYAEYWQRVFALSMGEQVTEATSELYDDLLGLLDRLMTLSAVPGSRCRAALQEEVQALLAALLLVTAEAERAVLRRVAQGVAALAGS